MDRFFSLTSLDLWEILLEKELVVHFLVKRLQPFLRASLLIVSSLSAFVE